MTSYKSKNNQYLNISSKIPSSPGDLIQDTISLTELKLHSLEIPIGITGGTFSIKKSNCLELKYFLSKSKDIGVNWRDGIGGFYEIKFMNEKNNYSEETLKKSTPEIDFPIDISNDLNFFRAKFGESTRNYLYFFCPFSNEDAVTQAFEYEVNLNKNPVVLPDKCELDPTSCTTGKTSSQTLDEILTKVKGDKVIGGVQTRLNSSSSDYFEVTQKTVFTGFLNEENPKVQKVSV